MTDFGPHKPSDSGDATWTNETLPLDVRRALLSQELERFTARRHGPSVARPERGANRPSAAGADTDHN